MSSIAPSLPRLHRPASAQRPPAFLVGRDFATDTAAPRRAPRRLLGLLLGGALLAALPLAGLRVQLTTLQYRLGESLRAEQSLDEERRALRVELQRLSNPKRLAEIAAREGFVRPAQVIDLAPVTQVAGGATRP
jgi:hypothetical protein